MSPEKILQAVKAKQTYRCVRGNILPILLDTDERMETPSEVDVTVPDRSGGRTVGGIVIPLFILTSRGSGSEGEV
jgi:hypothetical protein